MAPGNGRCIALEAGGNMAAHAEIWPLHLVYRLAHLPRGCTDAVLGKVSTLAGVTDVKVVPSNGVPTHLACSTRSTHAVVAAVEAKQYLQDALDEHNATL